MNDMDVQEAKKQFIDFLYTRGVYKRSVSEDLYLTRCPFCGDSRTRYDTGHFYILISPNTDNQMVYYCQRCQEHGKVNDEVIALLDGDDSVRESISYINKHGTRVKSKNDSGKQFLYFDWVIPDGVHGAYQRKIDYIENRLDISLTDDLMKQLKVIVSPYDFLIQNDIKKYTYSSNMMNILERCYVGFLSMGNSHILFRDITDSHEYSWLKYPITKESSHNYVMYSYDTEIDICSDEPLCVNLAEGVMDTIGVKEYFYHGVSTTDISVCGRNFYSAVQRLIAMGLFGENITLNLYLDNDRQYNNNKNTMSISGYIVDTMKALYGKVCVFQNLIGKDFGVKKESIMLDKKIM